MAMAIPARPVADRPISWSLWWAALLALVWSGGGHPVAWLIVAGRTGELDALCEALEREERA